MHGNEIKDVEFPNLCFKQIYDVQETFKQEFNSFLFTMQKNASFLLSKKLVMLH